MRWHKWKEFKRVLCNRNLKGRVFLSEGSANQPWSAELLTAIHTFLGPFAALPSCNVTCSWELFSKFLPPEKRNGRKEWLCGSGFLDSTLHRSFAVRSAFSRPRVLEDRVPGEVGQGRGGPFCPEAAGREISALLASPPSPVQQNIWSGLSRGTWCCVKIISTS